MNARIQPLIVLALGAMVSGCVRGRYDGAVVRLPRAAFTLHQPQAILAHQVILRTPGHDRVLHGLLQFTSRGYRLRAETPFGLKLFQLTYDGGRSVVQLNRQLAGQLEAPRLARVIWQAYRPGCRGAWHALPRAPGRARRACRTSGGTLHETVDRRTAELLSRRIVQKGHPPLLVDYRDYRALHGYRHPKRIRLHYGAISLLIVLVDFTPPPARPSPTRVRPRASGPGPAGLSSP